MELKHILPEAPWLKCHALVRLVILNRTRKLLCVHCGKPLRSSPYPSKKVEVAEIPHKIILCGNCKNLDKQVEINREKIKKMNEAWEKKYASLYQWIDAHQYLWYDDDGCGPEPTEDDILIYEQKMAIYDKIEAFFDKGIYDPSLKEIMN